MGHAKNQAIERDEQRSHATDLLVTAGVLSRCEVHSDAVYGGDVFNEDNDEMQAVADHLHSELGGERDDAVELVKDALEMAGITCTTCENNALRDD